MIEIPLLPFLFAGRHNVDDIGIVVVAVGIGVVVAGSVDVGLAETIMLLLNMK